MEIESKPVLPPTTKQPIRPKLIDNSKANNSNSNAQHGGAGSGPASSNNKKKPQGVKRKQADTTTPPSAFDPNSIDSDHRFVKFVAYKWKYHRGFNQN